MNNFSFEKRMEEIDNSISAYNELKQSSFISVSDNLGFSLIKKRKSKR